MIKDILKDSFFVMIGALIAACALECFLVPNNIIDGGIMGISIMLSSVTKVQLGIFTFFLNLPFIFLALKRFGKIFVLQTFFAIVIFSSSLQIFHHWIVTQDAILATVFGGIILGLGVGLILRNNASLDGIEIIALRVSQKLGFSVGEIIMFLNVFIYTASGFLFGFDKAMYSVMTYFIVYKVIDIVIEGFNDSKSVLIVTDFHERIGKSLMNILDASVTYIPATGGYTNKEKNIVYCVISRFEITKLKSIVKKIDPKAFIAIENVHEVDGQRFKKSKHL